MNVAHAVIDAKERQNLVDRLFHTVGPLVEEKVFGLIRPLSRSCL